MSKQLHRVKKLTVEIGMTSQELAFDIQSKISTDKERLLLEVLGAIFDRLVGENEVVKIEKLELQLGSISVGNLETDFVERLSGEMDKTLTSLLHEARFSQSGSSEIRIQTSSGDYIYVQTLIQSKSISWIERLKHFLEFGFFPWYTDQENNLKITTLVAQLMEQFPEQLRELLLNLANRPYVFKRLQFHLPAEQLNYLVAILGCGFSANLKKGLVAIKRDIFESINVIQPQLSSNKSQAELAILIEDFFWQETLFIFTLSESRQPASAKDEFSFFETMLVKMIAYFKWDVMFLQNQEKLMLAGTQKLIQGENAVLKLLLQKKINGEQNPASAKADVTEIENITSENDNEKLEKETLMDERVLSFKEETHADKKENSKNQEEFPDSDELLSGIYIRNAGMVILAPYLPILFRKLEWVDGKEFRDVDCRTKAVHLLQWMVWGEQMNESYVEFSEQDFVLNKLLCGMDLAEPIPLQLSLEPIVYEEAENMMKSVIENWEIVKRSSVQTIRATFLQKQGKLTKVEDNWELFIPRDSGFDILIDKLPWSISMLKMPWNKSLLYVEW